jgi:hypothetical protein
MSNVPRRGTMMTLAARRLGLLAGLALVVFGTGGCLEEKDTVVVNSDGSGRIETYFKYGDDLTKMVGSDPGAMNGALVEQIAKWDGIAAWTDSKAALEGGRLVLAATGYFADVSKVKFVDKQNSYVFTWKKTDGGFALSWTEVKNPQAKEKSPLEQCGSTPPGADLDKFCKDLRVEHTVVMPGPIQEAHAKGLVKKNGRTFEHDVTGSELKALFTLGYGLKARVDKKELDEDKANAQLKDRMALISLDLDCTCGPEEAPSELEAFRGNFEKAKASYASSDLAKAIDAQRKAHPPGQ